MNKRHKFLALAFFAAMLLLEACHRGSGCPGSDF